MMQYGEKPENAAYGKEFMNAMTYFTQHSLSGKPSLGEVFDWSHTKSVMDVGGGHGELLSHCMSFAGPSARGLLFDRPMVIKGYLFASRHTHTSFSCTLWMFA